MTKLTSAFKLDSERELGPMQQVVVVEEVKITSLQAWVGCPGNWDAALR